MVADFTSWVQAGAALIQAAAAGVTVYWTVKLVRVTNDYVEKTGELVKQGSELQRAAYTPILAASAEVKTVITADSKSYAEITLINTGHSAARQVSLVPQFDGKLMELLDEAFTRVLMPGDSKRYTYLVDDSELERIRGLSFNQGEYCKEILANVLIRGRDALGLNLFCINGNGISIKER